MNQPSNEYLLNLFFYPSLRIPSCFLTVFLIVPPNRRSSLPLGSPLVRFLSPFGGFGTSGNFSSPSKSDIRRTGSRRIYHAMRKFLWSEQTRKNTHSGKRYLFEYVYGISSYRIGKKEEKTSRVAHGGHGCNCNLLFFLSSPELSQSTSVKFLSPRP